MANGWTTRHRRRAGDPRRQLGRFPVRLGGRWSPAELEAPDEAIMVPAVDLEAELAGAALRENVGLRRQPSAHQTSTAELPLSPGWVNLRRSRRDALRRTEAVA